MTPAGPPHPAPVPVRPSVPFATDLATHGERLAVIHDEGQLTYAELDDLVGRAAEQLGGAPRLVLVAASNQLDSLVHYLAALRGGHVALLTAPEQAQPVAAAYEPDVVVAPSSHGGSTIRERRASSAYHLHTDLGLLMSTSGSTGSPKLVRLSHQNLQSNAESIATYLGIRNDDRAATTLPMHYCYGLSVINSHLVCGAGIILTDRSVVDARFWDLFRDSEGTTFPGVPHTFDLLDRVGFAGMRLPRLRYVTQAGGRLAPERVRHYAELGQRDGWDLFVMYGQTEATARMAYLPPDLSTSHPHAVGVPVPGGSFRLEEVPGEQRAGVGELVYDGPNVMLGYAHGPADLALGRTVDSLRTGDLARRTDAGLYEIVGRRASFAKIAGYRIDLDHLETILTAQGAGACSVAGDDGALVVAFDGTADPAELRSRVTRRCGLPASAVETYRVREIPRTPNGKPDRAALLLLRADTSVAPGSMSRGTSPPVPAPGQFAEPQAGSTEPWARGPEEVRALYAELLARSDASLDSTFVDLGGDSLSYVEVSIRLERILGRLPADWHTTPVRELAFVPTPARSVSAASPARPAGSLRARWRRGSVLRAPRGRLETSVVLRAVAIVLVAGTHASLFALPGGAHVLLAVAGYNFARFRLTSAPHRSRLRQQLVSIARIAVPSMVWITGVVALSGQYGWTNIVLLNGFLGAPTWTSEWHFWFIEILVYILLGLMALLAVPFVDRAERRFPFGFALALMGLGLLTRFELVGAGVPHMLPALWLFATGWAAARAGTWWQRLLLTAVVVAGVPGFFGNLPREMLMIGGLALLIWTASVPWPAAASRLASVLASSSLYIYLTHWQVYPWLTDLHPAVALLASLAAGVVAWRLGSRGARLTATAWIGLRTRVAILRG